VRPDLPPALEGVLNKALAKRAADRYQSAGALLSDFQAAVAGRPTRPVQSAPPLNTTVRAANPPVGGSAAPTINPAGVISGPPQYSAAGAPGGVPPSPIGVLKPVAVAAPAWSKKTGIWTQGFTVLFVLVAIAGGINTLVFRGIGNSAPLFQDYLAFDVLQGILALVGLRFATSPAMRSGFVFQAISAGAFVIRDGIILNFNTSPATVVFPFALNAHLVFLHYLFNLLSLACISYALVPRRPSDGWLTLLQIGASIGVILLRSSSIFSEITSLLDFEFTASIVCGIFSLALLVFRFQVWGRSPVAISCLALAQLAFAFDLLRLEPFFSIRDFIALGLGILAFLVLVQTERMKKAGVI
jgi:hypothetical protein